eukprot:NODE_1106_length_1892_cov_114.588468_g1051_i0.p1 GENE.NODE_1106_length_1892_cov_114.588468_g1051_i0~~NODE_1106_length_1892_cov_114.588468_g1051_i0.p1  ORF type:complete len:512 (+),score=108.77 NODE_1106_length_1892_cov_114.588468_g1051_i0:93-1628(+)
MPERAGKFKIEELPKGQLVIVYASFAGVFFVLLFIAGVFAPPRVYDRHCSRWFRGGEEDVSEEATPIEFLINHKPILHTSPEFSSWNQDFFFSLNIYRRPLTTRKDESTIGYELFPFKLNIVVLDNTTSLADVDWTDKKVHYRYLNCPRSSLNTTKCPSFHDRECLAHDDTEDTPSNMCGVCRITLAHQTFISADQPTYRIAVRVVNAESHKWDGTMKDVFVIETMYKYPSEDFTLFEVYFRYLLVFVSMVVAIMFWIQNRYYHPWAEWALEQKWTFILLCSLILFNNPAFFLNIYAEEWLFPCLNVIFTNFYLVVYLMCILLFTDNLYKSHRRLSNTAFYVPKFVLLGTLWLVGLLSFIATRMNQTTDIAENDIENVEVNGYEAFKVFVGILISIYILWLFYLIVRVIAQWSGDSSVHITRRMKFLWLTAVLMIGAIMSGLYTLVLQRNDAMGAVQFFSIFALYNLYTYLLAFMYWPANKMRSLGTYRPAASTTAPDPDTNVLFDDEEDL